MNRLLIANLTRLIKSKLFWCLVGIIAVISLGSLINLFAYGVRVIDSVLFVYPLLIGVGVPIFVSIFVGTEYSDGTIRNKLTVGHSRTFVYLANLITAIAAAFVMFVAYMIPIMLIGFPALGLPMIGGAEFIKIVLVSMFTMIAFCAIHTMVSMIYGNKAGATVINLLLAFLLLLAATMLLSKLTAPEYVPSYDMNGGLIEYVPNAAYVSGGLRSFYQAIVDILPMGQASQFAFGVTESLWLLALCSVAVSAVCTVIGIVVFARKNIK